MTTEKHPDEARQASVDEELNEPTRKSMEQLGKPDLDEKPNTRAVEGDESSSPGQNSDWLPQ